MNRLENIETTALKLMDRVDSLMSETPLLLEEFGALREALKLDVDWDNVPMGAAVTNKSGESGFFIHNEGANKLWIKLQDNDGIFWAADDCTVEPQKRTKLVKHYLNKGFPKWVGEDDIVLIDCDDGLINDFAHNIDTNDKSIKWFAVLDIDNESK